MATATTLFLLTIYVNGRETSVPVDIGQGENAFTLLVFQRDAGYLVDAFEVDGTISGSNLVVRVKDKVGRMVASNRTFIGQS